MDGQQSLPSDDEESLPTDAQLVVQHPIAGQLSCGVCSHSLRAPETIGEDLRRHLNSHLVQVKEIQTVEAEWYESKPQIEIKEFVGQESGWTVHGFIGLHEVRCARCGMGYAAVLRAVPIECADILCQQCNSSTSLSYNVERLTSVLHGFEFSVQISCTKCTRKKTFKSVLKSILNLVKIEVGSDGIKISTG